MKRSSPQPRVLGEDGKFQLIQNAMGVPGFHVAINAFTATTHQQLFSNRESFEINPQPFVKDQAVPIQQTIYHPLMSGLNGPWPDNFHRIIHSVRDCGLFPQATIPDNSYGLTYPFSSFSSSHSHFPCHHDSRHKWGEYFIVCSFRAPFTITFQHAAPKSKKPFDPEKPWDWIPPDPQPESYYTKSMTDEPVETYKRKLYQLTMTLPPNSMYVMSGSSRYDWRHGINVDKNHPVPSPSQRPDLYPIWNTMKHRRAVIFRATKVFSDTCLQQELEIALAANNQDLVTSIQERIRVSNKFVPKKDNVMGIQVKFSPEELEEAKMSAMYLWNVFHEKNSRIDTLKFQSHQVRYLGDSNDNDSTTHGGHVLGRGDSTVAKRPMPQKHEIIDILDSSDEEDNEKIGKKHEIIDVQDSSDDEEGEEQNVRSTLGKVSHEENAESASLDSGMKRKFVGDENTESNESLDHVRAARLKRFGNSVN